MSYSVYKHTAPNGKVYIGITSVEPLKRWQGGAGYRHNRYFDAAIKKYGWNNIQHEILENDLSANQAEIKEQHYISKYRSNNRSYGYNLTSGGEIGKRHSEETKRLISESKKGKPSSRKGEHHTPEAKAKMAESHKGKKMPPESHRACELAVSRPITQYARSGEVIAHFKSATEAAKAVNGNNSNIVACAKGKRKSAFGYIWKYTEVIA